MWFYFWVHWRLICVWVSNTCFDRWSKFVKAKACEADRQKGEKKFYDGLSPNEKFRSSFEVMCLCVHS